MDRVKENFQKALRFERPSEVLIWNEIPYFNLESVGAWLPMRKGGFDLWGVKWRSVNQEGVMCMPEVHPIHSLDEIAEYQLPDPADFAITAETAAGAIQAKAEGKLIVAWSPMLLFERLWALLGMEEFMVGLITHKSEMEGLIERVADYQVAVAEKWIAAGIDIYRGTDDLGGKTSLLISAEMWREMFKPHMERIFDVYKQAGVLIWFHCCGHIEQLIPDFVELGVDILDPIQASANDLGKVRALSEGKILLWGGIDSHMLMTSTDKSEIVDAVQNALALLGSKGGYVLAPDQSMPFPKENIAALVEAGKHFSK